MPPNEIIEWLLNCGEPWTRYRTLIDLLNAPDSDPQVIAAKKAMIQHPQIRSIIAETISWGEASFKRHNDAGYPIYKFSTLADFGLKVGDDAQLDEAIEKVLAHQAPEGAFQSVVNIAKSFGGSGEDLWAWMICDTPTLLYSLLSFGFGGDSRVQQALKHLISLIDENGWRCVCDPALGKFRGPGRKDDICPIANVYALKALSMIPPNMDNADKAIRKGIAALLEHWEYQTERKIYLFGIGTDFRKLKYPFVWYDILHVTDVLSRFPVAHADPRFHEMVKTIIEQADQDGRYTATSMFMAWKGWSFTNKKEPSPWLTFLVLRLQQRFEQLQAA